MTDTNREYTDKTNAFGRMVRLLLDTIDRYEELHLRLRQATQTPGFVLAFLA